MSFGRMYCTMSVHKNRIFERSIHLSLESELLSSEQLISQEYFLQTRIQNPTVSYNGWMFGPSRYKVLLQFMLNPSVRFHSPPSNQITNPLYAKQREAPKRQNPELYFDHHKIVLYRVSRDEMYGSFLGATLSASAGALEFRQKQFLGRRTTFLYAWEVCFQISSVYTSLVAMNTRNL